MKTNREHIAYYAYCWWCVLINQHKLVVKIILLFLSNEILNDADAVLWNTAELEQCHIYNSWEAIEIFCQIRLEISSDLKFCMLYWCLFLSFIGWLLSCWRSWNEKKICLHENRLSYIQSCQTDIGSEINHKENKTMFQPFIKWACWTYYGEASYVAEKEDNS